MNPIEHADMRSRRPVDVRAIRSVLSDMQSGRRKCGCGQLGTTLRGRDVFCPTCLLVARARDARGAWRPSLDFLRRQILAGDR